MDLSSRLPCELVVRGQELATLALLDAALDLHNETGTHEE